MSTLFHPDSSDAIERVEAPTPQAFERDYVRHNKPVILTGVATRWRAFTHWTPEYLKRVAGHVPVQVSFREDGNFHTWYSEGGHEHREITFGELVDRYNADPPDSRFYMNVYKLARISDELVKDVEVGDYVLGYKDVPDPPPILFMGCETAMPAHYHPDTEALLCQLQGRKKITLFGPDQYSKLYPRRFYEPAHAFSRVDLAHPDFERFPKTRRAKALEFWLEPGEILFIPVQWWHFTTGHGLQLSVTNFWCADKARYHYPMPGFKTRVHDAYTLLRKVRAKVLRQPWLEKSACG